jgi:hypothetical protein
MMSAATVTPIDRAQRIRRMREFDVDRVSIVERAILKAVECGYEFDAPIAQKKRDRERQQRMRYDGERPLAQFEALIDPEQKARLLERLAQR